MRLHHVGVVVADIEEHFARHYRQELRTGVLEGPVHDAEQDSYTALVKFDCSPAVELISPASPDSPVASHLAKGGGPHHLGFEVDDLDKVCADLASRGMLRVAGPDPAVLFDGRRVVFMYSRTGGLIELVEAGG